MGVGDLVYYIGDEKSLFFINGFQYKIGSTQSNDDDLVSIGIETDGFVFYRKDLHNFVDVIGLRKYKLTKIKERICLNNVI